VEAFRMIDDPEREKVLRRILGWLNIQKHDVLLDLGCGDGFFLKQIASVFPDITAIGCDVQRTKKMTFNSHVLICDAQHLPFRNEGIDKIIMNEVIEHLPNSELACNELSRVLTARGRVYIATPNSYEDMLKPFTLLARKVDVYEGHVKHFSRAEISNLLYKNKIKTLNFQYDGFFALFLYYSMVYHILKPLAKRNSVGASHSLSDSRLGHVLAFPILSDLGKSFLLILGKFDELFKSSSKCMGIHLVAVKSPE
jgi:SAM-dependent methyltransferase